MPTAYVYVRVSTLEQVKGLSLDDQSARAIEVYKSRLEPKGYAYGYILRDEGVSASKVDLFKREQGQKLVMKKRGGILEPGDMVVVDRFNRAFRSVSDWSQTCEYWLANNIGILLRDIEGANTDTAVGKFLLNTLAGVSQFESDMKSEYMLERLYAAKWLGEPYTRNVPPPGWKKYRNNGKWYLKPDYIARRFMLAAREMREQGKSYQKIADELNPLWCKLHNLPYTPQFIDWSAPIAKLKVWRWLKAMKRMDERELLTKEPTPNTEDQDDS